jgi:hypothetical protein
VVVAVQLAVVAVKAQAVAVAQVGIIQHLLRLLVVPHTQSQLAVAAPADLILAELAAMVMPVH